MKVEALINQYFKVMKEFKFDKHFPSILREDVQSLLDDGMTARSLMYAHVLTLMHNQRRSSVLQLVLINTTDLSSTFSCASLDQDTHLLRYLQHITGG